jgi:glyoxylase-like metal-dependent hydrolase (beta-lactamase superfamily II)
MKLALILLTLLVAPAEETDIEVTKLSANLYKVRVDTVNLVALLGPDGVLLSDCAYVDSGEELRAALGKLGGEEIPYVVMTHYHHDHCGGVHSLGGDPTIIAHRKVRKLLSSEQVAQGTHYEAFPENLLPDVVFDAGLTLHFGDEVIDLIHLPGGHSDGDVVVHFRKANVLHMADLLFTGDFPSVDYEHGGDVVQLAVNLQKVIDMVSPDVRIIAGHGRDYTVDELKKYREMVVATTDKIRSEMESGKSLEQLKSGGVLDAWRADWAPLRDNTEDWIETIYRSLSASK